jgi:ATP/maltotriose-dependent transcriptional regulator MalT/DNA-binding SARP family transcriptional activator
LARKKNSPSRGSRPILRKAVPRERLFKQLDRFQEGPVIWVSGPGGCGKTTLVSSYQQERGIPSLWYQVEEADKDLATFFYNLGNAFSRAFPKRKNPLPLMTPEYLQGIPTFARRFFQEAFSRLKPGKALVFDNFQLVPENSQVQEVILSGVNEILPDRHLVLISRGTPPPSWIRLQANQQLGLLTWEDLRLTLEETVEIARLRGDRGLPQETIEHVHALADGWAAGLMLMLASLARGIDLPAVEETTREGILHYFGNEIFARISPEVQDFLLRTAFLPQLTIKMAEELTGLPQAGSILAGLMRHNYFIDQRYRQEPVYQYHPLFRTFLRRKAQAVFPPEPFKELNRKAIHLLETAGQIEEAFSLAREADDREMMKRIILQQAPTLQNQGRLNLLAEWLDRLPSDLIEQDTWLLFWKGAAGFVLDPLLSRNSLERSYEKFKQKGETFGMLLAWTGVIRVIIYCIKGYDQLDHWIDELKLHIRDPFQEFPSPWIGAQVSTCMFSALAQRQSGHPEIEQWGDRALALTEAPEFKTERVMVLFHLMLYGVYAGHFDKATLALEMLSALTQAMDVQSPNRVWGYLGEILFFEMAGFPEKCEKAVSEGLEFLRTLGWHSMDDFALFHAILNSLNMNDAEKARLFINRLSTFMTYPEMEKRGMATRDQHIYYFCLTREELILGKYDQAAIHGEQELRCALDTGAPFLIGAAYLLNAAIQNHRGKDDQARESLSQGLAISRQIKSLFLEFNARLQQAHLAFKNQEKNKGLRSLREALTLGKEAKLLNTFIDCPADTAFLCEKALEEGIEVEYVQEIIRRRRLVPESPPVHLEHWPWPLQVFTLGQFLIYKDGQPLRFSRKAQKKPLDLLQALIAAGSRGIRDEELADALWPEADGDAALQSLKITLHRLRVLIGREEAVKVSEGRVSLDGRLCWIDSWAFERLLGESDGGDPKDAVPRLEKAVSLYQGFFLGREMEEPWLLAAGERLRSRFLRGVEKLGFLWSQGGEWKKAWEWYRKGLEVDGLAEEFCRGAMVCCRSLGLPAEGLSLYKRFEKRLKQELGIEPAARTRVVRDSLLGEGR